MAERRSVAYCQQRFSLPVELGRCCVADSKDASKAGNEAMLGYEPANGACADACRQELPPRHPAALHSRDLSYAVVYRPGHCHFCTHTQQSDAVRAF
jgi:hypothetical protein